MITERNLAVRAIEERRKAVAVKLLLEKTEYTIQDVYNTRYPYVFQNHTSGVRNWEEAFIYNPKKASKQFRRMLVWSAEAGVSKKVKPRS